jgi:DNA adenine methylase
MHKQIGPDKAIKPFLKWPGGKSAELLGISEHAPKDFDRFIDPFVGGGSVFLAVEKSIPAVCNDICPELIHLMQG